MSAEEEARYMLGTDRRLEEGGSSGKDSTETAESTSSRSRPPVRWEMLDKVQRGIAADLEDEKRRRAAGEAINVLNAGTARKQEAPLRSGDRNLETVSTPAGGESENENEGEIESIRAYEMLPSQKRFHESEARFKGFSGPVGSGKSYALCREALALCRENPGLTGLIGAPTVPMLKDSTMTTFLEVCEQERERYALNKSTNTVMLKKYQARVLFRSMDIYDRLRGTNLAWFGVDELTYVKEPAWERLEARLRHPGAKRLCGFGVWTPKGFDWVARRFRDEPVSGYQLIEAQPFENRHVLDSTPDYYERLKASYGETFYQQEVLGKYLNLHAGRVYYAFERAEHVEDHEVDAAMPLLWSWDFNINPMASVVCQRSSDVVYVLDEIVLKTSSTPEVCDEFAQRYGGHRAGVKVYGDVSGNRNNTLTGTSDYDYIRKFFGERPELRGRVQASTTNPLVRDRLNLVNARLKNAKGEIRLRVNRKCRELVKDFEKVCYKPDSGQIDKEKDSQLTHLSDALGYLLWQEFGGLGRIGERGQRIM